MNEVILCHQVKYVASEIWYKPDNAKFLTITFIQQFSNQRNYYSKPISTTYDMVTWLHDENHIRSKEN